MSGGRIGAFVRESREGITELNNGLLALEKDPDDEDAMEGIFRTAHTFKGNFGAMGFEDASDLAHAMEDLLDSIRSNETAVTAEMMDLLFAAVDRIEATVDEIDETGEPQSDPGDLPERLRNAISTGTETGDNDDGEAGRDTETGTDASETAPAVPESGVRLSVRTGGPMPAVDGSLVLDAFEGEDAPTLAGTSPDPEDIREGEFDGAFELIIRDADAAELAEFVTGLQPVESVEVLAAGRDEPSAAGEPVDSVADGSEDSAEDDPEASGEPAPQESSSVSSEELSSIRVDVNRLDEIHSLVEQLVTSRIKLRRAVEDADSDTAQDPLKELDKISSALQDTVMDLRLIPLQQVVDAFPRLVRDLAREEGKQIEFEMHGTDIELDRRILSQIGDPLIHILRNAVDHGIEPPKEREAAGKNPRGTIELRASRDRDEVAIGVEDDGGGLDTEMIKETAVENGLRTRSELEAMDRSSVYDLVYESGFSTAEEVDDVSGRGVGLDVVGKTVDRLDGSVSVKSEPGEGSLVRIRLPVTAAIAKVLFVEVGSEEYGVPIKDVGEVSRMASPKSVDGEDVIEHGEEIYPIVRLGEAFDVAGASENGDGVLIRVPPEQRQVALHCDAVTQQEEVVIRPATGSLGDVDGLSGTTVVGDGNVVPILDVGSI